jgi:hypothetical protein
MSMKSKTHLVVAIVAAAGIAARATHALAANNYDSPDWAPIYTGPTIERVPAVGDHRNDTVRILRAPAWRLSHKADRPR